MRSARCATLCAVLALGIFAGGCSHAQWSLSSGTPPPPAPPSSAVIASGPAGLQASGSGLSAALFAAVFVAAAASWSREEHPFPDPSSLVSPGPAPAPALAPQRRVQEQDCTKPIVDPYSNLRCK